MSSPAFSSSSYSFFVFLFFFFIFVYLQKGNIIVVKQNSCIILTHFWVPSALGCVGTKILLAFCSFFFLKKKKNSLSSRPYKMLLGSICCYQVWITWMAALVHGITFFSFSFFLIMWFHIKRTPKIF